MFEYEIYTADGRYIKTVYKYADALQARTDAGPGAYIREYYTE